MANVEVSMYQSSPTEVQEPARQDETAFSTTYLRLPEEATESSIGVRRRQLGGSAVEGSSTTSGAEESGKELNHKLKKWLHRIGHHGVLVWVLSEVSVSSTEVGISSYSVHIAEGDNTFALVYLLLSVIWASIALIDLCLNLLEYLQHYRRKKHWSVLQNDIADEDTDDGDSEMEDDENNADNITCTKRVKRFGKYVLKFLSLRLIVGEVIAYPLFLCKIVEFADANGFVAICPQATNINKTKLVLFIISSFAMLLYLYVVRLLIVGFSIKAVKGARDRLFQLLFFFNILGEMIIQTLIITNIAIRVHEENHEILGRPLLVANETELGVRNRIKVSPYVIYMMVAGYFIPLTGIISFVSILSSFGASIHQTFYQLILLKPRDVAEHVLNIHHEPKHAAKEDLHKLEKAKEGILRHFIKEEKKVLFKKVKAQHFATFFFSLLFTAILAAYGACALGTLSVEESASCQSYSGRILFEVLTIVFAVLANLPQLVIVAVVLANVSCVFHLAFFFIELVLLLIYFLVIED